MNNPPLVSIVLPTYNGSKYIGRSIESCLTQTYRNFELIIVNDCSTDETLEIIEHYANLDSRIRIINNAKNKKLPLSLNAGFETAIGNFHTWTSDDNIYAPNAIETLIKVFETDLTIDLVYTDYSIIDDQGKIIGKRTFNNVYDGFTEWLGCGACFLYKCDIFKKNRGYDPAAFLIEDYDFFLRAFFTFKFYYLNNRYDLYYYREHSASLTSTQGDYVNYISKIVLEKQLDNLRVKLPPVQMSKVYRKLAVFNAVKKSNIRKYLFFLDRLSEYSVKQAFLTAAYVTFSKLRDGVEIAMRGFLALLKILVRKRR